MISVVLLERKCDRGTQCLYSRALKNKSVHVIKTKVTEDESRNYQ